MIADPRATVSIGGRDVPAVATLLDGQDATSAYAKMVALAGTYGAYKSRTEREIRVFRLTASDQGSPAADG